MRRSVWLVVIGLLVVGFLAGISAADVMDPPATPRAHSCPVLPEDFQP